MRSRLFASSAVLLLVVLAGCGSSKKSSSTTSKSAATPPPATGTTTTKKSAVGKVPSRTYRVALSGKAETPPGAPKGTGRAIVTLSGTKKQVCWTFSALKGFASPTFAHIHVGAKGSAGNVVVPLSTGAKFKPKGCVPASSGLLTAISNNPRGYYVNIHSKKYPGGAVRSQL